MFSEEKKYDTRKKFLRQISCMEKFTWEHHCIIYLIFCNSKYIFSHWYWRTGKPLWYNICILQGKKKKTEERISQEIWTNVQVWMYRSNYKTFSKEPRVGWFSQSIYQKILCTTLSYDQTNRQTVKMLLLSRLCCQLSLRKTQYHATSIQSL